MNAYFDLLRKNPLFDTVPDDKIFTVISCLNGVVKEYREQTLLFPLEETVPCLGITLEGCVDVFISNNSGSPILIQQAFPGSLFVHALTVSGISGHSFEIYSTKNTKILFLYVPKFTALENCHCENRFKVMENLMKLIAVNNMNLSTKIQILMLHSLRQKLLLYFSILSKEQHSATIKLPFGRDKLSAYLSCDRSAVSRELGRMKQDGLIDYSGKTITLLSQFSSI